MCFFLRMRLRRFLISDPMAAGQGIRRCGGPRNGCIIPDVNRGGWSWKRQLGITNAKRRVSRATGVPWTKSGRQRKVGAVFWKLFK